METGEEREKQSVDRAVSICSVHLSFDMVTLQLGLFPVP
jgi:hypothetical protein